MSFPSFDRRVSLALSLVVLCGCALSACTVTNNNRDGGGVPPGTDGGRDAPVAPTTGLRVEPPNQTVVLDGAPIAIEYHAIFRAGDGSETDVSGECTWSSTVPGLGAFAGSTFTTTLTGGVTTILCQRGADIASTLLTITGNQTIIVDPAPADAPDRFGGTVDPSHAPSIVYPEDHVMVPPNLGELEFHFTTGGGDLFELAFRAPTATIRVYVNCAEALPGGCAYTPDATVWGALSTALRGQGEIPYTLRGVDGSGVVGESPERHLRVAAEDITGGLYYWNTAGSIDRFEFGVRGARAENFITIATTGNPGGVCVGCHALSRDGMRIAVGTGPVPTGSMHVFDVRTRAKLFALPLTTDPMPRPPIPSYTTFSPDHLTMAMSSPTGLVLRDTDTGMLRFTGLGGGNATMPDWSPDGNRIVYVRYAGAPLAFEQPFITNGSIEMLVFEGGGFVPGATLVTGGGNNFYPAFSPDGEWVSFNRSASNTANGDATDAELWIVRADGSEAPRHLDAADRPGDSWAKWDPTVYADRGSNVFWLSWSSTRGFGLRWADGGGQVQLWMAAFDESLAESGADPMLAAFRLPFQDAASGNHIAQWVTSIERLTCEDDTDCGGEFCVDGRCYEERPDVPF